MAALLGCAFYLSIGTRVIDFAWRSPKQMDWCNELGIALGSLSVIDAFVFFLDAIFGGLALHKSQTRMD